MLILVQKENEKDQVYTFQYIYFENFQIYQLPIMYHFVHTNHYNDPDFLIQNPSKLFLHVYDLIRNIFELFFCW